MRTIDFTQIRSAPKSRHDSFEALAVHLFRHSFPATSEHRFHALRGDGGDGGVEAYFQSPTGAIAGVQAKYFFKLGADELGQIDRSITTALENYPALEAYWVYIPFNLTGRKAKGKLGKSETERFDSWRDKRILKSAQSGRTLTIELCGAQTTKAQLQTLDVHGGLLRYWFSQETLTEEQVREGLRQSEQYAGPRYTAALDVRTQAHEALDFFGGTGNFAAWQAAHIAPLSRESRTLSRDTDGAFSLLAEPDALLASDLLGRIGFELSSLKAVERLESGLSLLRALAEQLAPLADHSRQLQEEAFNAKYGAHRDTESFRQHMAEMEIQFPAHDMDQARKAVQFVLKVSQLAKDSTLRAMTVQSFLLVGPAGIGKTHAIVSAAIRRLAQGGFSVVMFGEDFVSSEPWEVLRLKLGFGAAISRAELFEVLQACAAHTGLPFLIAIDALNDSPRAPRWKDKLPELLEQVRPYGGIRVVVSTRDTYRDVVVDARFPGLAFDAAGFAGRESLALEAFASHYGLATEITPIFASELANPLFLHLACQSLREENRNTLDVSLPGLIQLFESHLRTVDRNIRHALCYRNPTNLARAALLVLAGRVDGDSPTDASWGSCVESLRAVTGLEIKPEDLLDQLQHENMLILSEDGHNRWIVRLAYQRYGDLLRALSIVERCSASGSPDLPALRARFAEIKLEREGLLEALAVALPERAGVEITSTELGIDPIAAAKAFARGLLWRSRASIDHITLEAAVSSMQLQGLWTEVWESTFKLALVPAHPLNAKAWLHVMLSNMTKPARDTNLSYFAYKSYEATGSISSLLFASLHADIGRWPPESRTLAMLVLGWLSSLPDRRIRDRATKAMTRLLLRHPELASSTLRAFLAIDDDYIKESLALALYGAALLAPSAARAFGVLAPQLTDPALHTPANIMVREHVQLLWQRIVAAGGIEHSTAPVFVRALLADSWPSAPDVQGLLDLKGLPSNMRLLGRGLLPDFWRYQVEPRLRDFDLRSAGISHENIGAWIMREALRLGYGGSALRYDLWIQARVGSGRGRQGHAERLGKKYYWIALHRLVALLADHLPLRPGWNGDVGSRNRLWSQNLRKMDPTDHRDLIALPRYPDEILAGPRYLFPARDGDLYAWIRDIGLSPHETCLLRTDSAGTAWVTLDLSVRDVDREDEDGVFYSDFLMVDLSYTGFLVGGAAPARDLRALEARNHVQVPSSYRRYLGEYPDTPSLNGAVDQNEDENDYVAFSLLRGGEWEYEYASDEATSHLESPSPMLVRGLGLRWDGQRGWVAEDGSLAAFHSVGERRAGLFLRKDLMERYLRASGQRLLYRRFASANAITTTHDGPGCDIKTQLRLEKDLSVKVLRENVLRIPEDSPRGATRRRPEGAVPN